MMAAATTLKALCAVLALASTALAAVHPYQGEYFYAVSDAFIFRGGREGMIASKSEAVDEWGTVAKGVSNGKSYIRFSNVVFERPKSVANEYGPRDGDTGLVQAGVCDVNDRDRIGYSADGYSRRYCCDKDLVAKTRCYPGRVIVQQNEQGGGDWPWVTDIYFSDNETLAYAVDEAVTIEKTGMYYLWFVVCDPNLAGVTVSGQTTWKNPQGYLPGMMAPNLKFYGLMALAYLVLGFSWFVLYALNWRDVLAIQNCITVVVFLGMVEMATWYFDYTNFNATGFRPYATTLFAVLLGTVRKTVSRMLILVVSMGYGVVRPTLGGLSRRVLALGAAYFTAASALDVMTNVGTIDDLTSSARIILVLPVAVLDAVFILWIFTALSRTLSQLSQRRQGTKLTLYRQYTNALAISVVVSSLWIAYEMYFKMQDSFNEHWQTDYINNAFWHILSFLLLTIICVLWRPTDKATRYAYDADAGDQEIDELLGASAPSSSGDSAGDKKEVEMASASEKVFAIDDEEGGGKMA